MSALVTNNAWGTLSVSISDADTRIALSGGQGNRFPMAVAGTSWFYATLIDSSNNLEVVKCTARVGDTLTVMRGQDGTQARAYANGSRIELRACAALLNEKVDTDTYTTEKTALDERVTRAERAIASITVEGVPMSTAGGDMTGPLKYVIEEGSTTGGATGLNDAKDTLEVLWKYGTKVGAGLMVYRSTHTGNPNGFVLQAKSADGTAKQLVGKTDGTLTWNGNFSTTGKVSAAGGLSTTSNVSVGGTLTVSAEANFAEGKWNKVGTSSYFGAKGVAGVFCIKAYSSNPGIAFYNTGDVQVSKLTVSNGDLVCSTPFRATTMQTTSDRRLKSNLSHVQGNALMNICGYRYDLKTDGKTHIGLIAQDVEQYYPEAVSTDEKGMKSLDYNAVVAILLNAVRGLQRRIEHLENRSYERS